MLDNRSPGYKSNAKTDGGKVDEQIVGAKFNFRYQIQLLLLEQRMQKLTWWYCSGSA